MKLIILDRDGVINYDSEAYIKSPDEWVPIPGSLEAIASLTQAGYTISVATNQSGVARGYYDLATLEKIHQKMHEMVSDAGGRIDSVFLCPHGPEENCVCRKPKAGLFKQIAAHYRIELTDIPAVGDSLRDIQAAQAVGCQCYLVLTGNGLKTRSALGTAEQIKVCADLASVVTYILV